MSGKSRMITLCIFILRNQSRYHSLIYALSQKSNKAVQSISFFEQRHPCAAESSLNSIQHGATDNITYPDVIAVATQVIDKNRSCPSHVEKPVIDHI